MIKFETHLHNAENSACATAPARAIPRLYKDAGYGGIFVTNHYNVFALDFIADGRSLGHRALMDKYLYGYRAMREEGEKIGLKVLLGAELSPHRYISSWGGDYPAMEFLTYGFDEEFLYQNPDLHLLSQKELFTLIDQNGFVMYQAHPFREYCTLGDPHYMHGAEVKNLLNRSAQVINAQADDFADRHNLLKIAGTDFHHLSTAQQGLGGVYLPDTIQTPADFARYVKENALKFIE